MNQSEEIIEIKSYKDIPLQKQIIIDEQHKLELCEDAQSLYDLVQNNKEQFLNTMTWVKDFNTIQDAQQLINIWNECYKEGNKLCYLIKSNKDDNNDICGFFCYRTLDYINKSSEIGYMMDQKYQGQGILRKCLKYMIEYGFNKYQIQTYTLNTSSLNLRSLNVGYKLGFIQSEVQSNAMNINGTISDQVTLELNKNRYFEYIKNQ